MRTILKTSIAALAAVGLALAGAAAAGALEGTFTASGETTPFTFADGVISGVTDDGIQVHDTYAVDGDKITITASENHPLCPGVAGVYTFVESGDQVTFTLVEDTCEARVQGMTAGPWTRVQE